MDAWWYYACAGTARQGRHGALSTPGPTHPPRYLPRSITAPHAVAPHGTPYSTHAATWWECRGTPPPPPLPRDCTCADHHEPPLSGQGRVGVQIVSRLDIEALSSHGNPQIPMRFGGFWRRGDLMPLHGIPVAGLPVRLHGPRDSQRGRGRGRGRWRLWWWW